ncbi:hypothetical protein BDN72DRAFT_846857 [Pluteus cervinus]|uniref:Uncharacterized protein n=1 Tax=Pluteus cervinus TaxID=181527 RepID=A0ACD3AH17_9AGAR|nr:hypothetical protein BDN72DRAFT_846857 [Pluteus cervinus]
MSTGDHKELRNTIDGDIAALFERIRCLYVSRNALAPINSLQPEILSQIFLLVRDFSSDHAPSSRSYLDWLPITQVSQHWRHVAIECATLWTHLPSRKANILRLFLARSRTCPISIIMNITTKSHPFFRSVLSNNLYRIRNLHLIARPENWNNLVSIPGPGLCSAALELKELAISGRQVAPSDVVSWPQYLLGGNDSHLRRLTISKFPFLGYLPAFNRLTTLCLDEPNPQISLVILLHALRQMPNLRGLTVKESNEQDPSEDDGVDEANPPLPVVMPYLNEVTIHSPNFEMPLFISNSLRFLQSPGLTIHYKFDEWELTPDSEEFSQILGVVQQPYQNGITPISRLRVGAGSFDFQLVAWDIEANLVLDVKISCTDDDADPYDDFPGWFHECHSLPLAHLVSLELYGTGSLHFFQQHNEFPYLEHLTAEDEDAEGGLAKFLLRNFDSHDSAMKGEAMEGEEKEELSKLVRVDTCGGGTGDSWSDIALPSLETMTFRRSQYNTHNHKLWLQALTARKRHGYGLKKIILQRCYGMTVEMAAELRAVVEVEWDKFGM